jgi:CDP-diglyceride synthetase
MDNDSKKKEYLELVQRSRVRGFFGHLAIYIVVNAFLVFLNFTTVFGDSRSPRSIFEFWAIWPIVFWGIGIASQAYSVFFTGNDEMRMRELEIELGIPTRRGERY